jgi:flavin reductase (DIM6/NTAB) family NADH-FMN oxidoreductase RutF
LIRPNFAVKPLMDPPRVLFCMIRASTSLPPLRQCRRFASSILAAQHLVLADRFAGRQAQGKDRFAGARWRTLITGVPILCDALAAVDCELEELIERHSHIIVIGRAAGIILAESGGGRGQPVSLACFPSLLLEP